MSSTRAFLISSVPNRNFGHVPRLPAGRAGERADGVGDEADGGQELQGGGGQLQGHGAGQREAGQGQEAGPEIAGRSQQMRVILFSAS